jgi:hypothetical protein
MAKLRADRQAGNFAYDLLSMADQLLLESDLQVKFPIDTRGSDRLRTRADFETAFHENRDLLLAPRSRSNPAGHHPGRRSWCFWVFEHGLSEMPRQQILELHKLHLLSGAERRELTTWLALYPFLYSAAERALIESWGPPPGGAEVLEFPGEETEDDSNEDE